MTYLKVFLYRFSPDLNNAGLLNINIVLVLLSCSSDRYCVGR